MRQALKDRIARYVTHGYRRVSIVIGIVVALIVAALFTSPWTSKFISRLEFTALDTMFNRRRPIVESPEIIHIDIDDNSILTLGDYPWRRIYHAQLVRGLSHLGAKTIAFDIEFKNPSRYDYNDETGTFVYQDKFGDDLALASAIDQAGNVILAYSFDISNPFPPDLERFLPAIEKALSGNAGIDEEEVIRRTGVSPEIVRGRFESIRRGIIRKLIAKEIDRQPDIRFDQLVQKLVPGYTKQLHKGIQRTIHKEYTNVVSKGIVDGKTLEMERTQTPSPHSVYALMSPMIDFCRPTKGFGHVNAIEDSDGILRHVPMYMVYDGRYYLPLSVETLIRSDEADGWRTEVSILPGDRLEIRLYSRADGGLNKTISVPIDEKGLALVNWAGSASQKPFTRVPYAKIIQYYHDKFEVPLDNLDGIISKYKLMIPDEKNGAEKDRLASVLSQLKREIAVEDVNRLDRKLVVLERECTALIKDDMAKTDAYIESRDLLVKDKKLSPRIVEQEKQQLKAKTAMIVDALNIISEVRAASSVLENDLRSLIGGKICFVGSASTASGDLHPIPINSANPGVDLHSDVVNMLLTDQVFSVNPLSLRIFTILICGILAAIGSSYWTPVRSILFAFLLLIIYCAFAMLSFEVLYIPLNVGGPVTSVVFVLLSVTTFREFTERRAKRTVQKALEGRTSKTLVTEIIRDPDSIQRPRKFFATVFFSDIKGFTPMSESMAPEVMVKYLNTYHNRMSRIILDHEAYLDKFLGDGIMADFGVPIPCDDHAERACSAALKCIDAMDDLNKTFGDNGLPLVETRIGINSGNMIAGSVGSAERADYTILGDSVNLAARLEVANKIYATSIIISESTYDLVKNIFDTRELDIVRVTGKKQAVRIFELISTKGAMNPQKAQLVALFAEGLTLFRGGKWLEALTSFRKALQIEENDKASRLYAERCEKFMTAPPAPDWDGVFDVLTK